MVRLLLGQSIMQSCANEHLKRFGGNPFFRKRCGNRECLSQQGTFLECDKGPVGKGGHKIKSLSGSKKENRINFIQEG